VTQGRVSKIEHGLLEPTPELVGEFSRALEYPVSFFYQPGYMQTLPSWFHRKRKHLPRTKLDRVHAEIAIRIRNIAKLLNSTDINAAKSVPQIDIDEFGGSASQIAQYVREHWAMPRGPVTNLIELIEKAGVLVVPCDFGVTEIDAVGMRLQGMPPLIFVNASAPTDRLRFTVAHELAHLIMHALPNSDMEQQADAFASEFLMPEQDILPHLRRVDLTVLGILKRIWRVSMAALLYRAKTLKVITTGRYTSLMKQMSALGFRRREPAELDLEPESPRLLENLFAFHRQTLNMSLDEILRVFSLYEKDYRRLYITSSQKLRLVG
jgi:Zn-dependent peptidase ImmA (M78 family)